MVTAGGLAFSDSEKAEAIADSLDARFQLVNDPSNPAVIGVFNEAVRAYSFSPANEPNYPTLPRFKTPFGLSKSARHQVRTVYRIRP